MHAITNRNRRLRNVQEVIQENLMELTIEQALQRGIAAQQEGNLEEAERLYRAILQAQPMHSDANHNLGLIAVSVKKADAALPLFKTAIEANPKIEQFWVSYIDALVKAKHLKDAKQTVKKAINMGFDAKKLRALVSRPKGRSDAKAPTTEQLNSLLEYYQTGRLSDAEKLALSFTREFPKHQFGWKVLGAVLRQTGRKPEAVNANQRAVALSPQDAESHNNLGITLQELGSLDEATVSYKQAIAVKPDFAEAHSNLGITLQELGRLDEALASFKRAIAVKLNYAEAHNNLGITLQELGRLDEAIASYKQAIAVKPDYAEAHYNLGNTLKELGRLDKALASYTQAIAVKPDFAESHYNMGNTLKKLGGLDEAIASFRRAIAVKPDYAEAQYNLAITLQELGRLDEAIASYIKTIAVKPDFAEANYNLGITLQELGRLDEAIASYKQAIAVKPDYAEAHYNLGNTLNELGSIDEALANYTQAITLQPLFAEAHSNLGITLQELGRLDEALASYAEAIKLKPDFAEPHSNLGIALKELGRLDEALASCKRAIALNPNYPEAHNNLGVTLQELGRLDEALASYRQAIELKPGFVDGARNLVKLPVGLLDSDDLNLCEEAFDNRDNSTEYQIKYFFFLGNLLKHRGSIEQSFNAFCKANKLKLESIKDRIIPDAKNNGDSLIRIDKWMPSFPELAGEKLVKLFIMGPSRSGKSSVEYLLKQSSDVKALYEGIKHSELIKNKDCVTDSSDFLFENVFSKNKDELVRQGYKIVTSTNPASIFYSDYIIDLLPNAYFIILNRDFRDVSPEIFISEYNRKNYYSYDANEISKYLDIYNRVCETLALKVPDRCLTISFDDIFQAPENLVDQISRLVGSSLSVNHLKRNVGNFESESLFRSQYPSLSEKSNS